MYPVSSSTCKNAMSTSPRIFSKVAYLSYRTQVPRLIIIHLSLRKPPRTPRLPPLDQNTLPHNDRVSPSHPYPPKRKQLTFVHSVFNMIAPQTGTRFLYTKNRSNALSLSASDPHWLLRSGEWAKKILQKSLRRYVGSVGCASRMKSS